MLTRRDMTTLPAARALARWPAAAGAQAMAQAKSCFAPNGPVQPLSARKVVERGASNRQYVQRCLRGRLEDQGGEPDAW